MVKIGEIDVQITATTSKLRANLAQASSLIRDFSLVSQGLTSGISEAFRQVSDVAIKGLQIGIAALVGSFALAAKVGADFEDEMLRAFTIMKEGGNAAVDSLSKMTSTALELGRETLFSAIDAAQGMQVLARAGFNTREVLDSIGPVMNLAIADNLELAESADIVIAALRGFNLETRDAGRVTDILALGAAKANTNVSTLGEAFKYVAPVAAGMGISIEETVAAIGILSDAGLKGSLAGTTLRRAFSELISPTAKSKKILDELGIVTVTSAGKLRPFASILSDLKTKGMTAAQAMEVFGLRGGPGMVALLSRGSGALRDLTNALENSKGTAEDMSQAFRTTVKGRVRDLTASIVDLGLAFSEKFKKPLADAIFSVRNFIVDIVNVGNRTGIFRTIIMGVQDVLKPIIGLIKELAADFKAWLSTLTAKDVLQFFSGIKKGIEAFIESFKKGEVGAIVKDTLNVFIELGKTVIGTIQGITKAWMALPQGFRDAIRPLFIVSAVILKLFGGVMNIIFLFITLGALISSIGLKLAVGTTVLGAISSFLMIILAIVIAIGVVMATWRLITVIGRSELLKNIWELIKAIIIFIVELIGNIGTAIKNWDFSNIIPSLDTIKQRFDEIGESIKKAWNELNNAPGWFLSLLGKVSPIGMAISAISKGGKAKDGVIQTGIPGGGFLEAGGGNVSIASLNAREEIETIKKMIGQSERMEGVLGPAIRTSLLVGLQDRLDKLEKIIMEHEGNLEALNRQTIKPETDRKNKSRIGAGLE